MKGKPLRHGMALNYHGRNESIYPPGTATSEQIIDRAYESLTRDILNEGALPETISHSICFLPDEFVYVSVAGIKPE